MVGPAVWKSHNRISIVVARRAMKKAICSLKRELFQLKQLLLPVTYFFISEFEFKAAMSWWLSSTGQAIIT